MDRTGQGVHRIEAVGVLKYDVLHSLHTMCFAYLTVTLFAFIRRLIQF